MTRIRRVLTVTAFAVALVLAMLLGLRSCGPEPVLTVVAAGDMACDETDPSYGGGSGVGDECRAQAVSDLAIALEPDALLGLGDYQYELPTSAAYRSAYGSSWGRLHDVTVPARGNQEYKVHDANTFTDYFGDLSGDPAGYWSKDLGSWHVVVLDSNCTTVLGGCAQGSAQQQWLEHDLSTHDQVCTVALMHHPRWSSGIAGDNQSVDPLWRTLAQGGVDLLLSGHEADYERFPAMDVSGADDPHGLTELVVGVGGQAHYRPDVGGAAWRKRVVAHRSDYVDYDHHGFLELELGPTGWRTRFHPLGAETTDATRGECS